jgi:hypothetical protein
MQITGECNNNSKVCSVAQNIRRHEMFICLTNVFRLYSRQKGNITFQLYRLTWVCLYIVFRL